MKENLLMPESMANGKLVNWLIELGDRVRPGDVVAEVETDKALMQIESPYEGVLAEIQVPAGSNGIPANAVLAVLST
jgi:pyruvate dehydrogenase E2 component (dihydrolipoyllysine-residue acetyltransferase)